MLSLLHFLMLSWIPLLQAPARGTSYDSARLEAEINGQLCSDVGTSWALNNLVAVSDSSDGFAVNIFSTSAPPPFHLLPRP